MHLFKSLLTHSSSDRRTGQRGGGFDRRDENRPRISICSSEVPGAQNAAPQNAPGAVSKETFCKRCTRGSRTARIRSATGSPPRAHRGAGRRRPSAGCPRAVPAAPAAGTPLAAERRPHRRPLRGENGRAVICAIATVVPPTPPPPAPR